MAFQTITSSKKQQNDPHMHTVNFDHSRNIKAINRKHVFINAIHKKMLKNQLATINLEREAKHIRIIFYQSESVQKSLVEIRTKNWCNLGLMLIDHQINVLNAGHGWDVWVVNHFPFIGQRRIEQCMELARFGENVEPFYYMGLDRLYDLFHKLLPYKDDPEFKHISRRFGFTLKIIPADKDEKAIHNKQADKVREYCKFEQNVKNFKASKELLCGAIQCGAKFSKADYQFFNNPTKTSDDHELYLLQTMTNAGTPAHRNQVGISREGINVILSKLIQTIDGYEKTGIFPEFVDLNNLDTALEKLTLLQQKLYARLS